ncbi:MAG: DUF1330 domain-containing protein [Kordiimonadaceae bacterium]|nr:DUF1330 domain-containing protein [Kordiimonadaceae bacterium]
MSSYIDPERAQFEAFKDLPRNAPLNMLNLIKLRETAVYEDGAAVTGAEAYAAYGRDSGPIFKRVGGTIIWRGEPKLMLIGPETETWDLAFVAYYPTASAFLEMVTDPVYRIAVKHRQAAVADSRLLRCHEQPATDGFG